MPLLEAPEKGVTVRMYRPGHGDCFLLAFPREGGGTPVYVLIDCGLKPGSQDFIHKKGIGEIVAHLGESTGYHLDLAIITHEHQDHVNGIWKQTDPYFKDFTIDEAWFAWTEDPTDALANTLRKNHRDQLLGLVEARRQLALAVGEDDPTIRRLDTLLSLEFGSDAAFDRDALLAAVSDPAKSVNKQGLKLIKQKASENRGVRYLGPGDKVEVASSATGVRAFVFGPPRDENLLKDEDPVGTEAFPDDVPDSHALSFTTAVQLEANARTSPFGRRYCIPHDSAFEAAFFRDQYGQNREGEDEANGSEVLPNAPWRRIDGEWLYSADTLALKLNTGINNTSLVLAFELPHSKKVLFFPGDAQRGNWHSWKEQTWKDGDVTITVRDLLGRTVLYKVGHHGSHNATLAGTASDDYPNLSWMGQGQFAQEFTAMITAVNEWALTKNNPPWRHPLPSIKKALEQKAKGRIFQTDVPQTLKPDEVSDADWDQFISHASFEELYFDYTIMDE